MAFSIFNQKIPAMRPRQGQYVDGVWVDSPAQTYVLSTSVQPTKESDVRLLPEGRRIDASFTLYSKQEIKEKDQVVILGSRYEVLHVGPWQNNILPHFKAIAVKMQEQGRT